MVTASVIRPITPNIGTRAASAAADIAGRSDAGIHRSAAIKRVAPAKPRGATAATVNGRALMRTTRPTIAGSPPKRRCQIP
jgi:hypothetical protein